MTLGPQRRTKLALALPALASALLSLSQAAGAQANDPPKADGSLERAQKAADSVFHWIKLNADKGASRQTPTPAPAPAPVARKPAAAPIAAAPRPAPTPAPARPPLPTPAATQTAAASSPEPETAIALAPAPVASEPEEAPQVLLASAQPTPEPAAPAAVAAKAVEPPPPVEEELPLKLLSKVNPEIPRQLRGQSFHNGFAQVQFTVQPDGKVGQVQVIKASHARLGTAAIEAVRQWRFAPIPKPREAGVEISFNSDEG